MQIYARGSFEAIIKVFENASYIGELRQRWLEIKKLNNTQQIKVTRYP